MLLTLAAIMGPSSAEAYVIVAQHNWNSGGLDGWTNVETWVHLSNPGSGGIRDSGYLRFRFDATSPEPSEEWMSLVYVKADALFAGNWTTRHWVEFDFWAEDVVPGAVQLRWGAATNENYWSYSLAVTATQTWTHLKATFDDWEAWMYPGATEDQFLADLASIDWIGVWVFRNTALEQSYGIDDFTLAVPEPNQWWLLGAALVSSGLSFIPRRKRNGMACQS